MRIAMAKFSQNQYDDCFVWWTVLWGGEGNGPMDATPKGCGSVISGMNPVATEMVCARLMDFDYQKLRFQQ